MATVLVLYYSRTGNTKAMAELVADGAQSAGGEVELKTVADAKVEDLLGADAIVMGSPTYYGTMAAEMKRLLDDSVSHHGELDGKVGGAFSSSANIGGGNETTILDILKAMLIHGMVIKGDPKGDHYGPVAIGSPDKRSTEQCKKLGRDIAELAARLSG